MTEAVASQDHWNMQTLTESLEGLVVKVRGNSGAEFGPLVTDSRRVKPGCVFVAIRGETFDGHDFVEKAVELGASAVIVERESGVSCPEFVVKSSTAAYGMLAKAWRAQFCVPVICVVGANGKTTTTQMIASILRTACGAEHVVATEGNFNNGIGVPMTLLRFNEDTLAAVVEAGMNHPGEMADLANWIRPTVVVVTNAQREHQEFINGVEGSARENGLAIVSLSTKGTVVLPLRDGCLPIWQCLATARGCQTVTYCEGENQQADVVVTSAQSVITIRTQRNEFASRLALGGKHALHDAAAAAAATLSIGVKTEAVARGLADFTPVRGRGVRHVLSSGAVLIDDAYNANPDSMRAAIDVLSSMPGPRLLVAGDMGETGRHSEAFHTEIGAYAKLKGIDRLYASGNAMQSAVQAFGAGARHFQSTEELEMAVVSAVTLPGTVLVKASNFMGYRKLVDAVLQKMGETSV